MNMHCSCEASRTKLAFAACVN